MQLSASACGVQCGVEEVMCVLTFMCGLKRELVNDTQYTVLLCFFSVQDVGHNHARSVMTWLHDSCQLTRSSLTRVPSLNPTSEVSCSSQELPYLLTTSLLPGAHSIAKVTMLPGERQRSLRSHHIASEE